MKPHLTRTWARLFAATCLGLVATAPAYAEIETIVPPGAKWIQSFSAPKLPLVPGWELDLANSVQRGARILMPADAKGRPRAVIMVRAVSQKLVPEVSSIDQLINVDHMDRRRADVGVEITEIPVVTDKAGHKIRVFAERASNRRNFGMMAYVAEKDGGGDQYWTIFSLRSDSQDGLAASADAFQDLLRAYR